MLSPMLSMFIIDISITKGAYFNYVWSKGDPDGHSGLHSFISDLCPPQVLVLPGQ